jgi:hypothetical protein
MREVTSSGSAPTQGKHSKGQKSSELDRHTKDDAMVAIVWVTTSSGHAIVASSMHVLRFLRRMSFERMK